MKTSKIELTDVILDDEIQPRVKMNQRYLSELAGEVENRIEFPPVVIFHEDGKHFLSDGFHRVQATKKAGKRKISAIVHQGNKREAILWSVGANAIHGLRRTNADKRKVVMKLLLDKVWGTKWSDGKIAMRCAVSQAFVSKLRRELTQNGFKLPSTKKGRDGRVINTVNIGKKRVLSNQKEKESSVPCQKEELLRTIDPRNLEFSNKLIIKLKQQLTVKDNRIKSLESQVKELTELNEWLEEKLAAFENIDYAPERYELQFDSRDMY